MKKTDIVSTIEVNLADSSAITAELHREVESNLLNEIYPDVIFETRSSNTITNENTNAQYLTNDYQIYIAKQGRTVTIYGTIINGSSFLIGDNINAWFFEIVNTEFQQKANTYAFGNIRAEHYGSFVFLQNNKLFCNGIQAFGQYNFTLTYFTEN